ncbi:MAG: hypothetical protein IPL21_15995 [Saprospirales bacterium]|nr:hypothetical protein [Saprospirales bacterium]
MHPIIHAVGKSDYYFAGNIDKAKRDFNHRIRVTLQDAANELKELDYYNLYPN